MDHFREIKNKLTWHDEGKFEVVLVNGVIRELNFCEPGKGAEEPSKCLTSTNLKFLKAVHANLTDLLLFMEKEEKLNGYKYANETLNQTTDAIPGPTIETSA